MRIKIIRKRHGCPSWRVGSTLLSVLTQVLCDSCDHGQTAKRRRWNKVTWRKMRNPWPVFKADIYVKMKLEVLWFINWPLQLADNLDYCNPLWSMHLCVSYVSCFQWRELLTHLCFSDKIYELTPTIGAQFAKFFFPLFRWSILLHRTCCWF